MTPQLIVAVCLGVAIHFLDTPTYASTSPQAQVLAYSSLGLEHAPVQSLAQVRFKVCKSFQSPPDLILAYMGAFSEIGSWRGIAVILAIAQVAELLWLWRTHTTRVQRETFARLQEEDRKVLEQIAKRFRAMVDSAPVLIWVSGDGKQYTDFNREWLNFTGRSTLQDLGNNWTQDVHPDDVDARVAAYNSALARRQPFNTKYRLRRHDGIYRVMMERAVPRFCDDGSFAGYVGCLTDITETKQVQPIQAELGGQLIRAQEEERSRVARELHDGINQRMALLANGLAELERTVAEGERKSFQKEVNVLWRLTNDIATDIQQLSHQLHPSKLHYLGLASAVRDLCQEFARQGKVEVDCLVRDLPAHLEENISLNLFRTVQESLHNVAKHSGAAHVKVELVREADSIRLRVSDDGMGFQADQTQYQGLGLLSMHERARLIGGELLVWSRPSLGTQVEARVPLTPKRNASAS